MVYESVQTLLQIFHGYVVQNMLKSRWYCRDTTIAIVSIEFETDLKMYVSVHFVKTTKVFQQTTIRYLNKLQYVARPSMALIVCFKLVNSCSILIFLVNPMYISGFGFKHFTVTITL